MATIVSSTLQSKLWPREPKSSAYPPQQQCNRQNSHHAIWLQSVSVEFLLCLYDIRQYTESIFENICHSIYAMCRTNFPFFLRRQGKCRTILISFVNIHYSCQNKLSRMCRQIQFSTKNHLSSPKSMVHLSVWETFLRKEKAKSFCIP